jgi:outer membrane lipoprotein SlyB
VTEDLGLFKKVFGKVGGKVIGTVIGTGVKAGLGAAGVSLGPVGAIAVGVGSKKLSKKIAGKIRYEQDLEFFFEDFKRRRRRKSPFKF